MGKSDKIVEKGFAYVRNTKLDYKFGAHVHTEGGIYSSVIHAMNIGANSFALFLKSPRRWVSPALSDEDATKFKEFCKRFKYNPRTDILPHGSYFINLANPDKAKQKQSVDCLIDDLERCEKLDIGLYNFHPGSSLGSDKEEALQSLADNINTAIERTKFVRIVVENMAGHGNLVGSNLDDLSAILGMVKNKDRLGFCIDTCHTFAAGYDIREEEGWNKFWDEFEEKVGLEHLSSLHLNDSKAPLGANRDLHQRIGWGFLGLESFRLLANDERLKGIPLVLEVPNGGDNVVPYGEDIKLLEWLEGKGKEEIVEKSEELQKLGEKERKEQQGKFDKKRSKGRGGSRKRVKPNRADERSE
ncbi:DEKNAAC105118 [Brettanomyces naardenensis]|uniref:Apurinic-apyrimidinic endonuclease 1 n=1 Tax=Brettanomyces naardenensis TaxID=13370 RepID=A0A448YT25_BRENA|nr:DEKNAAC105118 [Brettanomyces naardenensis]